MKGCVKRRERDREREGNTEKTEQKKDQTQINRSLCAHSLYGLRNMCIIRLKYIIIINVNTKQQAAKTVADLYKTKISQAYTLLFF